MSLCSVSSLPGGRHFPSPLAPPPALLSSLHHQIGLTEALPRVACLSTSRLQLCKMPAVPDLCDVTKGPQNYQETVTSLSIPCPPPSINPSRRFSRAGLFWEHISKEDKVYFFSGNFFFKLLLQVQSFRFKVFVCL